MGIFRDITISLGTYPVLAKLANVLLPPWVTVLFFHRISVPELGVSGITPEHLRNCLQYLKQNDYAFISLEDALARALNNDLEPRKWAAFTLDDGFEEQVRLGAEIFQEFNCPATCFLVTDFVDGKLWPWDYQLKYLAARARRQTIQIRIEDTTYSIEMGTPGTKDFLLDFARNVAPEEAYKTVQLIAEAAGVAIPIEPPIDMQPTSWEAVRAAEQKGMRFGPHSTRHFILSRLDEDTLRYELSESARRIREECRNPSNIFCYPSGKANEFDKRAIKLARALGFAGGVSTEPGYLSTRRASQHDGYRYSLPRLPLPKDMNEFKQYVSWVQYLREQMTTTPLRHFYEI